jgi:hypothetical protein
MYVSTEHKQPRCIGKHVSEKKPSGHWDTFNRLEHHLDVNICKCFCLLTDSDSYRTDVTGEQKTKSFRIYVQ